MGDWESMVFDWVTTKGTALYALIGDRVYPLELPQSGPLPAVVYTIVDDVEELDGHNGVGRIQFTAWSRTYAGAKQVRDALRVRLRTLALAGTTDRIEDIDVSFTGPAGKDPDLGLYRRDLDAMILHVRRQ